MLARRRFLSAGVSGLLGAFVTPAWSGPGDGRGEAVPDGSASKGMITPEADQAIEGGLSFLRHKQLEDGAFGTGAYQGNVAVTSLAALAFMAGGHQPNRGAYGRAVTRALEFVLGQENRDGRHPGFLHNPNATPHGPMYGHGFGTLFLAEASGMVHDKTLREKVHGALRRAVRLILDAQNREGGWRYNPEPHDADLSVTICQIMALRAARNAGVAVPRGKVDRCVEYVKRCQDRTAGWFRYMAQGGIGGGGQGFARTAAGVVALNSAGIYKGEEVERGLKYLLHFKPPVGGVGRGGRPDMHYYYGHYYAVQAMWTAGGTYWSEWYPAVRDELINRRVFDGRWEDQICSHYATAMACLILQVPNNYLTIMQK